MSNPIPDSGVHHIPTSEFEEEEDETRRSLLIPLLVALIVLAVGIGTLIHFTYHKSFATGEIAATIAYPIHSERKAAIQVLGASTGAEESLYLLPTVKLQNHISLPLFIESFSADMTTADGATYHSTAAQKDDFAPMYAIYPVLAQTVESTGDSPLQRDTRIENGGGTVHGLIMVHFPVSKDVWEHRQSASITVTFYHQPPLSIPFPSNQ